jgi:replicative DNA helicase
MSSKPAKSFTDNQRHDAAIDNLKIPPHSVDAERAVLGGVILDNNAWDQVVGHISENDFYCQNHRVIFQAITHLVRKSQPFDVLTLAENLKSRSALEEAGGELYLFELVRNTPTAANVSAYSDIVRERSIMRQLIQTSQEISHLAFNPDGRNCKEILDTAESKIFQIAEHEARKEGPVDIASLLSKTADHIEMLYHSGNDISGLASGFKDMDAMTSGMQKGDLLIVAGRPSMGKTAFAVNIAEHVAIKMQKPVLIFSMEMPSESLAMRMLSSLGRIDQHHLRTGKLQEDDWPKISSAVSMLSETSLFIDDTPALSPADLRARARRFVRTHHGELGLIVVDYLQLMQVPGFKENRTAEITDISRALKALAKELKVPVLALSQLNRSLEQRGDKRPVMSDLRESGAIEQDADVILFIYRDEVYNEDSPEKGIAEVIIAKQRNGPIGKIKLTFLGRYTKFENFSDETYTSRSHKK